jgi:hypothetical protein
VNPHRLSSRLVAGWHLLLVASVSLPNMQVRCRLGVQGMAGSNRVLQRQTLVQCCHCRGPQPRRAILQASDSDIPSHKLRPRSAAGSRWGLAIKRFDKEDKAADHEVAPSPHSMAPRDDFNAACCHRTADPDRIRAHAQNQGHLERTRPFRAEDMVQEGKFG